MGWTLVGPVGTCVCVYPRWRFDHVHARLAPYMTRAVTHIPLLLSFRIVAPSFMLFARYCTRVLQVIFYPEVECTAMHKNQRQNTITELYANDHRLV